MNTCRKRSGGGKEGRGCKDGAGIDWEGRETEWLPLAFLG